MQERESRTRLVELIRPAVAGDEKCLEQLLLAICVPVRRYLRGQVGGDEDLVDDLAQEVLLRVVSALPQVRARDDGQFLSWSMTVARNLLFDWMRAFQREHRQVESNPACADEVADDSQTWGDGSPSGTSLEFQTLLDLLHDVLDTLPTESALILELRLSGLRTWTEVGTDLQISSAAAKRRFQRALQRVRKEMLSRIEQVPEPSRSALQDRIYTSRRGTYLETE